MTTVVTSSNRSYHIFRKSALTSFEGRSDPGYVGNTPRPSSVMYTFAVIFRVFLTPRFAVARDPGAASRAARHIREQTYIPLGIPWP